MVETNPLLDIRQYLEDTEITPTLMEALAKLAAEKPDNPLLFIGSYMLRHGKAFSEESETAADTAEDYSSEAESEEDVDEPEAAKPIKTEGVLECSPLSMKFTDLSRLAFSPECQYGMSFAFINEASLNTADQINRSGITFNGTFNGALNQNGAY